MTNSEISTLERERARRREVFRQIDRNLWLGNSLAAVLTNVYFLLIFPFTPETLPNVGFNLLLLILIIGIAQNLGNKRPPAWQTWYLRADPAPPDTQFQKAALQFPFAAARQSLIIWLLVGIIFSLFGITSQFELMHIFNTLVINFLGVGVVAGGIATVVILFALERLWQPEIPIFFPAGHFGEVDAFRLTLRRRVLFLFVLMLLPLLLLAAATYIQVTRMVGASLPGLLALELFVIGLGGLLAVTLAQTLGQSLVQAVERLQKQVRRVCEGNLATHMRVMSNDEFGDLAIGLNSMVDTLRQEETIRRLFSLYVTPEVAAHAITHGAELGGQLTEATVLFSDIRGFTSLTEQLGADAIIALLNRYFNRMTEAITAQGGLVNKFGGDSLLAVFGTPLNPNPEHAPRAVQAAQAMLATLEAFNAEQRAQGEPELHIGIGVATGPLVAGNVGSQERLEYTVIGDTVNLASRLEALTKTLGVPLLLSDATAQRLTPELPLTTLGQIEVRGKQQPVPVYGIGVMSKE